MLLCHVSMRFFVKALVPDTSCIFVDIGAAKMFTQSSLHCKG